ncbi:uncharacterized protein [Rutidosis leptorrhynchoides]|uniref:uncharacterized protein n=1 Tax=Rutidosis leptorrhynchoides TaxID=125765 RepID=UPI003A999D31
MVEDVTDKEINGAIFDMDSISAAGPYGYSSHFFKKAWNIVGKDIETPNKVFDFRPIACCNAFLEKMLYGFGFHPRMVGLLMTCVNTASFSICINGEPHGFFMGGRGLRQGDPISLYLFTLVMEVLTLIMAKRIKEETGFMFHYGYKKLKISHVCFADDLLVLCHGDMTSIHVIKKALDEFSSVSGLYHNLSKSIVFFGNVPDEVKSGILQIMPFTVSKLPMRYLGIPLIAKKLGIGDCFLWNHGDCTKGKARVAWKLICRPKDQGGLEAYGMCMRNALTVEVGDQVVSRRDRYQARLGDDLKVARVVHNNQWLLFSINMLVLKAQEDRTLWIANDGSRGDYQSWQVWQDLRGNYPIAKWYHVIWFPQATPKHAFLMWVAIQKRLVTHDRLQKWYTNLNLKCALCDQGNDSHEHLFFKFVYAAEIWKRLKDMLLFRGLPDDLYKIVDKLFERNWRIFKNKKRNAVDLYEMIVENIRVKLLTLKVKRSIAVIKAADI